LVDSGIGTNGILIDETGKGDLLFVVPGGCSAAVGVLSLGAFLACDGGLATVALWLGVEVIWSGLKLTTPLLFFFCVDVAGILAIDAQSKFSVAAFAA
jgi:hypothetical protein